MISKANPQHPGYVWKADDEPLYSVQVVLPLDTLRCFVAAYTGVDPAGIATKVANEIRKQLPPKLVRIDFNDIDRRIIGKSVVRYPLGRVTGLSVIDAVKFSRNGATLYSVNGAIEVKPGGYVEVEA